MVIFHVGVSKAGTTLLINNVLKQLKNYHFLKDTLPPVARFLDLLKHREDFAYYEECLALLRQLEETYGNFVITDDTISQCSPSMIASRLAKLSPDAKILISVRNQYDTLRSWHNFKGYFYADVPNTAVLNRKFYITFDEFLAFYLSPGHMRLGYPYALKYATLFKSYANYFARDQIKVVPLEYLVHQPVETGRALSDFLGESVSVLSSEGEVTLTNPGPSKLFHLLKKIRTWIPIKKRLLNFINLNKLYQFEKRLAKGKKRKYFYSLKNEKRVFDAFATENRELEMLIDLPLAQYRYPVQGGAVHE